MNTIRGIVLVLAFFLLRSAIVQPVNAQDVSPEEGVRVAVQKFGQAYRKADVGTLRGLLTRDYVHTNGSSGNRINRDQWLTWVGSQKELLENGELLIETYELSDIRVRIYGNAGVVTGKVKSNGIRKGEPFSVNVRFTNVWIKEKEVWRRAAFHDSPIPESDH